jgi:hypothetical protein
MLRLDETNKRPSETDDLLEKVKVVAGPQPIAFGVLLGCGLRLSQEATLSKRNGQHRNPNESTRSLNILSA